MGPTTTVGESVAFAGDAVGYGGGDSGAAGPTTGDVYGGGDASLTTDIVGTRLAYVARTAGLSATNVKVTTPSRGTPAEARSLRSTNIKNTASNAMSAITRAERTRISARARIPDAAASKANMRTVRGQARRVPMKTAGGNTK